MHASPSKPTEARVIFLRYTLAVFITVFFLALLVSRAHYEPWEQHQLRRLACSYYNPDKPQSEAWKQTCKDICKEGDSCLSFDK